MERREMSVEESLAEHAKVMKAFWDDPWMDLSPSEKAVCMNYKRQLLDSRKIENSLIMKVNEIYSKYPDFHMACVP